MFVAIPIFAALFFLLALMRLDYALFFLIAALPSYLIRFPIFGIPSTLLEMMILIAFSVWFFKKYVPTIKNLFKKSVEKRPYPFSIEIIILIIVSFVAAGIAGFNPGSLGTWKAYFFEPILVFILVLNIYQEKKDWQKILWSFLLSASSIIIFAIYQKITGEFIFNSFWAQAETRRVVSWFEYPNAIGLYLAPLVLLFVGWFFSLHKYTTSSKNFQRILIAATAFGSVIAIYFAKSEGALIGVVVGLFVFGLLAGKKQRLMTITTSLILLVGLLFIAPARNLAVEKLTFQDLSGQIRLQQWRETFKSLQGTRTLTGAGLNNYQAAVAPYHQEGIFFNRDKIENFDAVTWASSTLQQKYWQPVEIYLYPHNIFLNFWTELGLLGALIFMWLLIKAGFLALRLAISYKRDNHPEKYLALGLLCSLVTITVHGLVDVPYFKNDLAVMFWIFLAFIGLLNFNQQFGDKNIRN